MLPLLLALTATAQNCDDPVTPADIAAKTDDAQLAWATLDEDGFVEIVDALPSQVACLEQALSPTQAAAVHRMIALRAFLSDDEEAVKRSVRSATRADPDYTLSDRIAPEGGKLWRMYEAASATRPPGEKDLDVPSGFTAWVDGIEGTARPDGLPAIVQVGGSTDDVRWSRLVAHYSAVVIPDLGKPPSKSTASAGGSSKPAKPAKPPKAPKEGSGSNAPLWIAAGSSGAVAAGLFGASAGLRSSFDNDPSKGKYTAVNATFLGSIGMTAVTGGLVTAALVRKR